MGRSRSRGPALLIVVMALVVFPRLAAAQTGSIAGVVRDTQGGVLQGVLVEVTSPQLIEKVRSTTTNSNGRYQIVSLPVGTYKVLTAFENDELVRDPDESIGGTAIQRITVAGDMLDVTGFKITGAPEASPAAA